MKVKILLIIFWIPAFAEMTVTPDLIGGTNLFAQTTDESIFDEGAEVTIDPNDIGEDVRLWAQNTAIKLKELLVKIKTLSIQEKRELLTQKIKECVLEAQNTRELLLMRFALNRALKLSSTFSDSDDELIVHYILLPIIKEAIHIYERADLPYLTANQNKSAEEIESPSYTAFSKAQIGYLLTVSNMNKSPEGQFEILKLALVWVTNDLLRSAETKRNPVNANLILNLKEIYFKYKNLPAEEITYTVLNRIRTMLLKTYQEMVPEKGKVLLPFMIYTPSQPDLVFKPQTKEEIPVKPKEEPKPKKVISNDHASSDFHFIRMGVGAGIKNNEPIINVSVQGIGFERGSCSCDGARGISAYILKGDFDISNNKDLDSQKIKVLGGRYPIIPLLSSKVKLGPYLNISDNTSDEAKKERYKSWFNTGLACNIQPFSTKNLNININAYWNIGGNNAAKTIKVNDLTISDASQEWQDESKKMDAEHYQQETEAIKAGQQHAQDLINMGYQKTRGRDGREYIQTGSYDFYKIPTELDRSTLVKKSSINEREVDSFTVEASCELISSIQKQDDLIFECGGYVANHKLEQFKGNFPSTHRNEFDPTPKSWGTHVGIEYRLWDQKETQLASEILDERRGKPFNFGPSLHLSYQVDNDQVAKEITEFFNPAKARDMITQTKTVHFYLKFDF